MAVLDSTAMESGCVLSARFCIVGSGMGGSAVAQKLIAAGQDVLLVEAGGIERDSAMAEPITGGTQAGHFACIELGGTTNLWHGICTPLDELDFEPPPWIKGSGWPIRRSDLIPFYTEAAGMMSVPSFAHWETRALDSPVLERRSDIHFDHAILENSCFNFGNRQSVGRIRWSSSQAPTNCNA